MVGVIEPLPQTAPFPYDFVTANEEGYSARI